MGRPGKWLKSFLTGKKDKEKEKTGTNNTQNSANGVDQNPNTTPVSTLPTTPKEKRRWSFRRSSATAPPTAAVNKDSNGSATESVNAQQQQQQQQREGVFVLSDYEDEQKKHALAMTAATAVAADAAVAAAKAAAAVIRLTSASAGRTVSAVEVSAAIKIQSAFRSYLARKALCALRGLVTLQALVRGHLVRKQAAAMLRCMQALVTVQAQARAQRLRMVEESKPGYNQRQSVHRKSTATIPETNRFRHSSCDIEENVKIVEMDIGETKGSTKGRNSYSHQPQQVRVDHKLSTMHYAPNRGFSSQVSPSPSAITDMSPQACSGHFEDYSFGTTQSSPQCYSAVSKIEYSKVPFAFPRPENSETTYSLSYDYPLFPNYMANTESSRAKARSQSAPKQRPADAFERQPSRRRASMEGRNVPRAVRMQRSSSHVGSTASNYHYPLSIKLDKSNISLKDSECGSSSTVLTNTNYCRSIVGFDVVT